MIENINVTIDNKNIEVSKGTTLLEISKLFQSEYKLPIILAKVDGQYRELSFVLLRNCTVELLTLRDRQANRAYVNGLIYLLIYASKKVLKGNELIVQHSIDKGIYINSRKKITEQQVESLKEEMKNIIKLNLPIEKLNVNRIDAIDYFDKVKDNSKKELLKYNTNSFITLYKLGNMYNFFFSLMPVETRCLERFDLKYLNENGFVLMYQTVYMDDEIKKYEHHKMIFDVFENFHNWASVMNIDRVPSLKRFVSSGNIGDLIRMDETLQCNRLLEIASDIYNKRGNVKIVLIAGPSSSGKTTTCSKLCMYLRSF